MNRDKVVWLGSALLFVAGVIWGMGWTKNDFFKVENIHDLMEIGSSIATVAAVVIGLTAWKRQLRAQADHDLARRLLVKSEQLQSATFQVVIDAQFCLVNENLQYSDWELIDRIQEGLRSRMDNQDRARVAFQADMLEARALWSEDLDKYYEELFVVSANASLCVQYFLMYLDQSGDPDRQEPLESSIAGFGDYLSAKGLDVPPSELNEKLSLLKAEANKVLKKKLQLS